MLGGVVAVLIASLLFFVPFPKTMEGSAEESSVSGIHILNAEREKILFERDGERGICDTGVEFRRAMDIFEGEDVYLLLTFRLGECSKLEHLALLVKYGNVCFYADGALVFDGTALVPASRTKFDTVVILRGTPSERFLENSGAKVIHRNAERN